MFAPPPTTCPPSGLAAADAIASGTMAEVASSTFRRWPDIAVIPLIVCRQNDEGTPAMPCCPDTGDDRAGNFNVARARNVEHHLVPPSDAHSGANRRSVRVCGCWECGL